MDSRPVRGCPPSLRPALLLAALAAVLLAPSGSARGLGDPVYVPLPVDTSGVAEVKVYVACGDQVCVWVSSKPCVGVVAAGLEFDVDPDSGGIYFEGIGEGIDPGAYGGYSGRCTGRPPAYVYLLDDIIEG